MSKQIKAKRHVHVCDQGHYGSVHCSNCFYDLENFYGNICPQCGADISEHGVDYNMGGSDFI